MMPPISNTPAILLDSKRLYLRRLEKDDLHLLTRLFCDPHMMHYLGGTWTFDLVTETLHEWQAEWGRNNYYYGALVRKDSSQPIGIAGFTENTIPDEPGLEFSWFILPEHQRQGFATEITREILAYAFEQIKIDRVLAQTHPENLASSRVLARSSFVKIDSKTNHYDFLPGFDQQALWEHKRADWKGLIERPIGRTEYHR